MSSTLSAFDSQKLLTWFSDDGSSYIHTIPSSTSPGEVRVETWCRVECIGEGAYGKVHREVCTEKGMVRAVKVIKKACLTNPTLSFETELSALTRMGSHPNYFVQLFGWFQDDASFYIAMEYMQCGDLNTMIIEFDGLSRDQIRTASKQLLLGLEIMHSLGFCHRDLKPQNILVVKWFPLKVKIADFGTTKVAGAKTPLTTFIGTPDYLAPEILDPVDVGCEIYEYTNAVDIWSLGCLVYAMATKQPPFPGRRGLTRYTSGTSPFPGKELESEMRRFIISLMRPLPHDRPTATQALEDLWLQPDADTLGIGIDLPSTVTQNQSHLKTAKGQDRSKITPVFKSPYLEPNAGIGRRQIHPTAPVKAPAKADAGVLSLRSRLPVAQTMEDPCIRFDGKTLELESGAPNVKAIATPHSGPEAVEGTEIKRSPKAHIKLRGDALIEGAANGHRNIVEYMLDRGADISHRDMNGNTALHRAVQHDQKDIVLLLLDHGADKMAKGLCGATPLIIAARYGFLELIKLLLNEGSDLTATDNNGFTALHIACQYRHLDVVSYILGLSPENRSEIAADAPMTRRGSLVVPSWTQLVNQLLEMRVGPLRFTVLHSAASTGDFNAVQLLLKGGANVSSRAGDNSTPLTLASTDGHYKIVKLLLDQGANITERDKHDYTALHLAAEVGHTEVVALLLEKGADTSAKEERGYTALQRAAAAGFVTIVELLIIWDTGPATESVTRRTASLRRLSPAIEQSEKEATKFAYPRGNTYTTVEVVNKSVMERSEIQSNHQSITITRQTDHNVSRIDLQKTLVVEQNDTYREAESQEKVVKVEIESLEEDRKSPVKQKRPSVTKQISGELNTMQLEANEIMKRKQTARKFAGKIQRSSCVIT